MLTALVVFPDRGLQAQLKESLPCINRKINISVFVVEDKDSNTGISEADIENSISRLNTYFDTICLDFVLCNITNIDSPYFDTIRIYDEIYDPGDEMVTNHYVPYNLNLYFISDIVTAPDNLCGHTYPHGQPDAIIMEKFGADCPLQSTRLLHQIGHYLGLLNTFVNDSLSVEPILRDSLSDEGELLCLLTGDLLCDTESDPSGPIDKECNYIGEPDSSGQAYIPPVDNIMSEYPDHCKCRFTYEQYRRMVSYFMHERSYMWREQ